MSETLNPQTQRVSKLARTLAFAAVVGATGFLAAEFRNSAQPQGGEEVMLTFTATSHPKGEVAMQSDDDALPSETTDETSGIPEVAIDVQTLTQDLADELGVPTAGVVVTDVESDGPAVDAGIRTGMVISRVGNQDIDNVAELKAALEAARPNGKALLPVVHFTQSRTQVVRIVAVKLNHV